MILAVSEAELPVQCGKSFARQLERGSRPKAVLPFGLRLKALPRR
jgi:hypothetical protein